jgi:hypothetical protein
MNQIKHKGIITVVLVTAGAALLLSGCSTTKGYEQADKTGAGIAEFRDEIVKGKVAIDATMKSLSDVAATATTDPRKAFEQYSKNVAELESTANTIRKRAESMKEKGQAYFTQWETELAQVNNPEIRSLAEQRKAKLQETFQSIRKVAGVDAAKPLFTKTTEEGLEVQKSMDAVVAELNTLAATLTPAGKK